MGYHFPEVVSLPSFFESYLEIWIPYLFTFSPRSQSKLSFLGEGSCLVLASLVPSTGPDVRQLLSHVYWAGCRIFVDDCDNIAWSYAVSRSCHIHDSTEAFKSHVVVNAAKSKETLSRGLSLRSVRRPELRHLGDYL